MTEGKIIYMESGLINSGQELSFVFLLLVFIELLYRNYTKFVTSLPTM